MSVEITFKARIYQEGDIVWTDFKCDSNVDCNECIYSETCERISNKILDILELEEINENQSEGGQ
jgi:hypothetical protein